MRMEGQYDLIRLSGSESEENDQPASVVGGHDRVEGEMQDCQSSEEENEEELRYIEALHNRLRREEFLKVWTPVAY